MKIVAKQAIKKKILATYLKKINVLWLVDHLGYDGAMHGAGKYYLNTIPVFDKGKFNITLCILRGKDNLTKYFEDQGIKIYHLERGKFDPMTLFDLIQLVKKEGINLIHAHGYGSANFGRLAGILQKIPTIIHAHDEDSYYPWYQGLIDFFFSSFTDRAIAVSESVRKSCIEKRKIPGDHVFTLYNAIPLKGFKIPTLEEIQKEKRRLGIDLNFQVVGTIAKLREEKGIKYLLESVPKVLSELPDTIFVIVGEGPLRRELETSSRQLKIDQNVIFTGFHDDIPKILSIFDIKVLPSVTEGFGLVLVEAMAMGKPIVATNVGGIKEILKDGETGLLVPAKDPEALAEKILYLLKNKNEAIKLGVRAKEESEKYDIHFHTRKLEEHYFALISSKQ